MTTTTADHFVQSANPEPHRARTKALLRQHPEIRQLIGNNPMTFVWTVLIVSLQVAVAWFVADRSWWWVLGAAYLIGAFPNHSLFVIIHESTHKLVFRKKLPFGWTHIPLAYSLLYSALIILGLTGVLGAIMAMVRSWRKIDWPVFAFLALAIVLMGVAVLARGVMYLAFPKMFFPVARYLMPVVIPVLFCLNRGWIELYNLLRSAFSRWLHKPEFQPKGFTWTSFWAVASFCLIYDIIAIASVISFYQGFPLLR